MEKILIIGSSNIDYMVNMDRFPVAGETLEAYNFMQSMGGKGANQAISSFRLGGDVLFITSLGKDINGKNALSYYNEQGINVGQNAKLLVKTCQPLKYQERKIVQTPHNESPVRSVPDAG